MPAIVIPVTVTNVQIIGELLDVNIPFMRFGHVTLKLAPLARGSSLITNRGNSSGFSPWDQQQLWRQVQILGLTSEGEVI